MTDIARLDVHVAAIPRPGLIRPRIEAALAGRPAEPGPEQAIGRAVAAAVAAVTASGTQGAGLSPGKGAVA